MDFDQMLETWRAQNTAPPYDMKYTSEGGDFWPTPVR